jgi:hypothetical protein
MKSGIVSSSDIVSSTVALSGFASDFWSGDVNGISAENNRVEYSVARSREGIEHGS